MAKFKYSKHHAVVLADWEAMTREERRLFNHPFDGQMWLQGVASGATDPTRAIHQKSSTCPLHGLPNAQFSSTDCPDFADSLHHSPPSDL